MKKGLVVALIFIVISLLMVKCFNENISNGVRVGYVSKLSTRGTFIKTTEGELTMSQTGMMGSGQSWEFSVDKNYYGKKQVADKLTMCVDSSYMVKLKYHQCAVLMNIASYRGETDYFVDDIIIVDKRYKEMYGKN
jgi:hypothetical protein